MRNKFFNNIVSWLTRINWGFILAIVFCATFWGVVFASCAHATPFSPEHARNGVIRVDQCNGGFVGDHIADLEASRRAGLEIRVSGAMYSACTFALLYDNVLVNERHTDWCFHAISVNGEVNRTATLMMWNIYPEEIRHLLPNPLTVGQEYHCVRGEVISEALEK